VTVYVISVKVDKKGVYYLL